MQTSPSKGWTIRPNSESWPPKSRLPDLSFKYSSRVIKGVLGETGSGLRLEWQSIPHIEIGPGFQDLLDAGFDVVAGDDRSRAYPCIRRNVIHGSSVLFRAAEGPRDGAERIEVLMSSLNPASNASMIGLAALSGMKRTFGTSSP